MAPVLTGLTADKESPQVIGSAVALTAVASDAEEPSTAIPVLNGRTGSAGLVGEPCLELDRRCRAGLGPHAFEARVRDGKHNAEGDDPLQYQFLMDGQVVQDWSDSPVWSFTASAEQVGPHAIEARVRDGKHSAEGDSASGANFEIVLPPNTAPVLTGLTADKESPQVIGTAVALTAVASDAENDRLQYQFLMDGQVVQDWSDSPVWSFTASAEQVGPHAIEAKVRDGKHSAEGDSASGANFEIVLPPNTAPVLTGLDCGYGEPADPGNNCYLDGGGQ